MATYNGVSVTPKKNSKGKQMRGVWLIVVSCGFDANGKRIRKKETFHGTRTDANTRGEEIKRALEHGIWVNADKVTFAEYAAEWHKERVSSGEIALATLDNEEYKIERLSEVLGGYVLKDIKPRLIEDAYRQIKRSPRIGSKPLSGTTMNGIHRLMHQILKDAVRDGLVIVNVCDSVKAPKKDTEEKAFLNPSEAARLSDTVNECLKAEYSSMNAKEKRMDDRGKRFTRTVVRGTSRTGNLIAVRLGLYAGMRKEETLGLRWCDVEKDCTALNVNQVFTRQGVVSAPKTKKSKRTILLDKDTARILKDWRAAQFVALRSLGVADFKNIPVCCTDAATYCIHSNFDRWLKGWTEEHGFEGLTYHQLRHTHASLMMDNPEITVKQVQTRLGHSLAATTLDIYTHAIKDSGQRAADAFAEMLRGKSA